MAIIQVETPTGVERVEIAGETPTEQEVQAIRQQFFGETSSPEIDLATASMAEIRDYARQRRALGVSPTTGQPLN
jgi:hypothetical protein